MNLQQEDQKETIITLTPNTVSKAGGCSGYQYGFTFDTKKEGDQELSFEGLNVLLDPQSALALKGSVIDYKEDFGGEGFSIQNPNVKKSCGCGHSVEI